MDCYWLSRLYHFAIIERFVSLGQRGSSLFLYHKPYFWGLLHHSQAQPGRQQMTITVEKVINNNLIRSHNESGQEILIMGCGLGFKKKPGDPIDEALNLYCGRSGAVQPSGTAFKPHSSGACSGNQWDHPLCKDFSGQKARRPDLSDSHRSYQLCHWPGRRGYCPEKCAPLGDQAVLQPRVSGRQGSLIHNP